ncbi:two-component sensor histidine kinase [Amycolatopsis deserti]|uniref:histidine kinase n=1 Tax=Amycolatopsis deserti TaxID=185696 RepID=A0ABQ3JDT5_9PSEU|nr:HAMP domain-containing sensor histidine kinase [Amycolatopsis deserti]GHF21526.1 two-component sensor histidine kinase [Amycolatopsis deserti]
MHLSARGRLTLLYTGLVLVAGVVLTALTYLLLRSKLERRISLLIIRTPADPAPAPPELAGTADQVRDAALSEFLGQAAIALAVVAVLAAVLGWLVAGRVLRPIRAISATARRLSAENLAERVPVSAPADELVTLAATINGMLDRIQQGIAERERVLHSQRMFTANAAHELRTPLTTVRTAIDVTLDGDPSRAELLAMTGDIATAVEHSRRTLDGLLVLARSQTVSHPRERVDLAALAAAALDGSATHSLQVRSELAPALTDGEPVLLERMVGNLVDNAVRYNHPGGRIEVTTGRADGQVVLCVSNTGSVVPDDAERLLEPFVRGAGARLRTESGAGLGLSIVHAVATAHGGGVSVEARPSGGLHVTVWLPESSVDSGS